MESLRHALSTTEAAASRGSALYGEDPAAEELPDVPVDVLVEEDPHASAQSAADVGSASPSTQFHAAAKRGDPPQAHSVGTNARQSAGGRAHPEDAQTSAQSRMVVHVPSSRHVGTCVTSPAPHTQRTRGHSDAASHESKSGHARSRVAHAGAAIAANATK